MNAKSRVAVVGGGLAGLAAAYDLARDGHAVTIIEPSTDLGGLASSLRIEGHLVERFYHFICRPDADLIRLVGEVGLRDKLHWHEVRTSFYFNGALYPFGTPLDLLRFSAIPLSQRVRFGLHILNSRYRRQWRWLDQIPAKAWLIESVGERAYEVIWHPLLKVKFAEFHDTISAAWIWHRIWRVARSRRYPWERERFGCLEHGTFTLVERLVERLRAHPGAEIRTGVRVQSVGIRDQKIEHVVASDGRRVDCDAVISTIPLPLLDRLVPGQSEDYFNKARQVLYIGVVCLLLSLRRPFSKNFWMNINDPSISFNGIIEQTNLNLALQQAGLNLLYIPFYVPTSDARYGMADDQIFEECTGMLKRINPTFDRSWVKEWHVSRTPHAQTICHTRFADILPDFQSPIRGLYVSDSSQFYPEDRSISAAIKQGRLIADMIEREGR